MVNGTVIWISTENKKIIDALKIHPRQTNDEIITLLLKSVRKDLRRDELWGVK